MIGALRDAGIEPDGHAPPLHPARVAGRARRRPGRGVRGATRQLRARRRGRARRSVPALGHHQRAQRPCRAGVPARRVATRRRRARLRGAGPPSPARGPRRRVPGAQGRCVATRSKSGSPIICASRSRRVPARSSTVRAASHVRARVQRRLRRPPPAKGGCTVHSIRWRTDAEAFAWRRLAARRTSSASTTTRATSSASAPRRPAELFVARGVPPGAAVSDLGWEIYPAGLGRLVRTWAPTQSGAGVHHRERDRRCRRREAGRVPRRSPDRARSRDRRRRRRARVLPLVVDGQLRMGRRLRAALRALRGRLRDAGAPAARERPSLRGIARDRAV